MIKVFKEVLYITSNLSISCLILTCYIVQLIKYWLGGKKMGLYYVKDAQFNIIKAQRAEKNVLIAKIKEEKMQHIMHLDEIYEDGIIKNLNIYIEHLIGEENESKVEDLIKRVNEVKIIQKSFRNLKNPIRGLINLI